MGSFGGSRPNVVLIHGHDLGRWLSCYGLESVPSPHLDRFARQSVIFDQAFSTAPLCTPARSSLFTGVSPHVNGLMGLAHDGWRYRRSTVTAPELLAPLGYDTALIGLQHEHPDPWVLGFDQVGGLGFPSRADTIAEDAMGWLRERRSREPYFLTVGVWEIHRPWSTRGYPHFDPAGVEIPAYLPDNDDTRADLAEMYGAISFLDDAVGRLLAAIDESEAADDTMVIFTTDHGAALPRAKGTLYDSGVGVALIVRPPSSWGLEPRRVATPVSHLDLVPSLLDASGGGIPDHLEGKSLLPALSESTGVKDERELFFEKTYHDGYDPKRAIRTPEWKYIKNFEEGPRLQLAKDLENSLTRKGMGDTHLRPRPPVELYDLTDDPSERTDLAGDPEYRAVVEDLDRRLTSWMSLSRDPLLLGPIHPAPRPDRARDAAEDLVDLVDNDRRVGVDHGEG